MNKMVPRMMDILQTWETCQLKPYPDGHGLSIGFGHSNAAGLPPYVDENLILKDEAEALAILVNDLNQEYFPQLVTLLKDINFAATDNEFSALLDVLYNRGAGRLRNSLAFRFLQHPEMEWFKKWASMALVYSDPMHFGTKSPQAKRALDLVWNGEYVDLLDMNAKGEIRLGLTLRRMDDALLFITKEKLT